MVFVGVQGDLYCHFAPTVEELAVDNVTYDKIIEVDRACRIGGVIYINDDVPEGMDNVITD